MGGCVCGVRDLCYLLGFFEEFRCQYEGEVIEIL
jgi:hypothetical protein